MRWFLITFFICAFCSCKKDIGADENTLNSQSASDTFYFKARFNGVDLNWIVPSKDNLPSWKFHSNPSFGYDSLGGQCVETYCHYLSAYSQIHANNPNYRPQIGIGFNMATQQSTRQEFLSWFDPGFKNYNPGRLNTLADIYNPAKNGAVVYYLDPNGKSWSSSRGIQQESFFESISLTDLPGINNGYLNKIWKAKFSCKLYDDAGNWIKVENGEMYNWVILP